jgi:hypothetical protein
MPKPTVGRIATSMGNLLDAYPPGPVHILWAPETEEP